MTDVETVLVGNNDIHRYVAYSIIGRFIHIYDRLIGEFSVIDRTIASASRLSDISVLGIRKKNTKSTKAELPKFSYILASGEQNWIDTNDMRVSNITKKELNIVLKEVDLVHYYLGRGK